MTVLDFLPVLSAGSHSSPKTGACVMEYVSLLAGEPWSDSPACTHPVLAAAARRVNDRLSDSERHLLVPLIPRLFGTAATGTDHEQKVLSVRIAVWSARQVLHLVREQDRAVCAAAIDAADGWCDGRVTEQECRDTASTAASAAAYAAASTAASTAAAAAAAAASTAAASTAAASTASSTASTTATTTAAAAAYAAASAAASTAAAAAAAAAATAASSTAAAASAAASSTAASSTAAAAATAASSTAAAASAAASSTAASSTAAAYAATAARVDFLTGLLDEHARLTGHTPRPLKTEQWQQLIDATT